ncbi:MAG: hypothetical protein ABJ239_12100 [Erythrobacter sp.]
MTSDEKRDALREKIEASEKRHEARSLQIAAKETADNATAFVKKHPLATMGGAIVVGLAIGAMTKPGRRLTKRSGVFAALVTDAAIRYGIQAIDKASEVARDGQDRLEDFGDNFSDRARVAKREAAHIAGTAADKTKTATRKVSRKAGRVVRDTRNRIVH